MNYLWSISLLFTPTHLALHPNPGVCVERRGRRVCLCFESLWALCLPITSRTPCSVPPGRALRSRHERALSRTGDSEGVTMFRIVLSCLAHSGLAHAESPLQQRRFGVQVHCDGMTECASPPMQDICVAAQVRLPPSSLPFSHTQFDWLRTMPTNCRRSPATAAGGGTSRKSKVSMTSPTLMRGSSIRTVQRAALARPARTSRCKCASHIVPRVLLPNLAVPDL